MPSKQERSLVRRENRRSSSDLLWRTEWLSCCSLAARWVFKLERRDGREKRLDLKHACRSMRNRPKNNQSKRNIASSKNPVIRFDSFMVSIVVASFAGKVRIHLKYEVPLFRRRVTIIINQPTTTNSPSSPPRFHGYRSNTPSSLCCSIRL